MEEMNLFNNTGESPKTTGESFVERCEQIYKSMDKSEIEDIKCCIDYELIRNSALIEEQHQSSDELLYNKLLKAKDNVDDVLGIIFKECHFLSDVERKIRVIFTVEGVENVLSNRQSIEYLISKQKAVIDKSELNLGNEDEPPYLKCGGKTILNFRNYYYTTRGNTCRTICGQVNVSKSLQNNCSIFDTISWILNCNGILKISYTKQEQELILEWYKATCDYYFNRVQIDKPKFCILLDK